MKGQWIGTYASAFPGTALIDIDEEGGQYIGYGIAYPNDSKNAPITFVRFSVPKASSFHADVPLLFIDPRTYNVVHWNDVASLYPGIVVADNLSVNANLDNDVLTVEWLGKKGDQSFAGKAVLPRTKAGAPSQLSPLSISSWREFKTYVADLEPRRFVFRGQADNRWRLRTSYHRTGRANLERYSHFDLAAASRVLSAQTSIVVDTLNPNPLYYGAFISLIQHHGFPTPLLDWTYSPYVAAFFAYHRMTNAKARKVGPRQRIRIFQFDRAEWIRAPQVLKLSPLPPHFSVLEALAIENRRIIPQQGIATFTNVDDIEDYIGKVEVSRGVSFLKAIDLPIAERPSIMRELSLMGVTAASLFPGLDGACEELKERFFEV